MGGKKTKSKANRTMRKRAKMAARQEQREAMKNPAKSGPEQRLDSSYFEKDLPVVEEPEALVEHVVADSGTSDDLMFSEYQVKGYPPVPGRGRGRVKKKERERGWFLSTCSVLAVGLIVGMCVTMTVPLLGFAQVGSLQANLFRAKFKSYTFEKMTAPSEKDVIPKDTAAVVGKDGNVTAVEDQKVVPGKEAKLPDGVSSESYYPGQQLGQRVVHVMRGDTLSKISRETGCSVDALAHHNEIDDVNLIYDGSSLRVPDPPKDAKDQKEQKEDK